MARRLIPFLVTAFIVAYLDRVNIGFAALTMNAELGFTPEFFGWGAGVFFIGYCLFEAPSNYVMHRVGARVWIARIMVSWGLVSALTAFIWSEASFVTLRLLLGVMEAGFAPGVILYLTYWIPAAQRARVLASFLIAVPLASAIGSPISGFILASLNGVGGISGWRWLFLMEALPSIILGIVCFFYLPDGPQSAKWLTSGEKASLRAVLEREAGRGSWRPLARAQGFAHSHSRRRLFRDRHRPLRFELLAPANHQGLRIRRHRDEFAGVNSLYLRRARDVGLEPQLRPAA